VRHERLQDVQRDAGVGPDLGVGMPECVREDACRVEGAAVLISEVDAVQPGFDPLPGRAVVEGTLACWLARLSQVVGNSSIRSDRGCPSLPKYCGNPRRR
jgi:hypothetical protein